MKNKRALEIVESLVVDYLNFTTKRYNKLKYHTYNSIYGDWDSKTFNNLRNMYFTLLTGEENFDKFYNKFDAPATASGNRPIAWGPRFLPDMISDIIWHKNYGFEEKVKEIEKLYKVCLGLEKNFKPKKQRNVQPENG